MAASATGTACARNRFWTGEKTATTARMTANAFLARHACFSLSKNILVGEGRIIELRRHLRGARPCLCLLIARLVDRVIYGGNDERHEHGNAAGEKHQT